MPIESFDGFDRAVDSASDRLGVPLAAAVATEPLPLHRLRPEDRVRADALEGTRRLTSWLLGRAALQELRSAAGLDPEAAVAFPHPTLSLTHVQGVAVAVARLDGGAGVGVDLERPRPLRPEGDRFFLQPPEQAWLSSLPEVDRNRERLRLWTVKEALFKANLDNGGTLVGHYRLDDPAQGGGAGWRDRRFRYATAEVSGGFLSLAVAVTTC